MCPGAHAPPSIFRAYDVRGIVGTELDAALMHQLGLAAGSEARGLGSQTFIVARDHRWSGQSLCRALIQGLCASGCDVVDLGVAPTPLAYFATARRAGASAAIVTASHNPIEYNGLKLVLAGQSATTEQIADLRRRISEGRFTSGSGRTTPTEAVDDYVAALVQDVHVAREMRIVVDCGGGTAVGLAPGLYRALGCKVAELDCDIAAMACEQRVPDPARPSSLDRLAAAVVARDADLGLGFDGDGDRLGVVDSRGRFVAIDRVLMLLAADLLKHQPGRDVIFDVKCSRHLGAEIQRHGGRPVMSRSGHSFLKHAMREHGALLAGELSGHILFGDRWNGFDDALYAGARLIEMLARDPRPSAEVVDDLPASMSTPELFAPLSPRQTTKAMQAVLDIAGRLDDVGVVTIDGLRAEIPSGWGLVRASNTQPGLVFRFEADDAASLDRVQDLFRDIMRQAAPGLRLPF